MLDANTVGNELLQIPIVYSQEHVILKKTIVSGMMTVQEPRSLLLSVEYLIKSLLTLIQVMWH